MKKFLSYLLCLCLLLAISGCAGQANTPQPSAAPAAEPSSAAPAPASSAPESSAPTAAATKYPERGIMMIVHGKAGGGLDMSARLLAPYLEKQLGTTVTVVNMPGGNNWLGLNEIYKSPNDGYILGYSNWPGMLTPYLDPQNKIERTYQDFTYIARHVDDPSVIVVRTDDNRYSTVQELVEYAKENELVFSDGGNASDDHIAIVLMNKNVGTKFSPVHMVSTPEEIAALLGGHVDGVFCNASEVFARHESGELKVLAVASAERHPLMPDVPTIEEAGYGALYNSASRGLIAPPNLDPAVKQIVLEAARKAMEDPEHLKAADEMGATIAPMYDEEFYKWVGDYESELKKLSGDMGWS